MEKAATQQWLLVPIWARERVAAAFVDPLILKNSRALNSARLASPRASARYNGSKLAAGALRNTEVARGAVRVPVAQASLSPRSTRSRAFPDGSAIGAVALGAAILSFWAMAQHQTQVAALALRKQSHG